MVHVSIQRAASDTNTYSHAMFVPSLSISSLVRSPGGMYDTLRPELITCSEFERKLMSADPTYVVSWDIFQHNAFP